MRKTEIRGNCRSYPASRSRQSAGAELRNASEMIPGRDDHRRRRDTEKPWIEKPWIETPCVHGRLLTKTAAGKTECCKKGHCNFDSIIKTIHPARKSLYSCGSAVVVVCTTQEC
jgi:hypothetical protein